MRREFTLTYYKKCASCVCNLSNCVSYNSIQDEDDITCRRCVTNYNDDLKSKQISFNELLHKHD